MCEIACETDRVTEEKKKDGCETGNEKGDNTLGSTWLCVSACTCNCTAHSYLQHVHSRKNSLPLSHLVLSLLF